MIRCQNCSANLPQTAEAVRFCPNCGYRQPEYQLPDIYPWKIRSEPIPRSDLSALCLYHAEACDKCVIVATIPHRRTLAATIALSQYLNRHRGRLSSRLIEATVSPDRDALIAATGVIK